MNITIKEPVKLIIFLSICTICLSTISAQEVGHNQAESVEVQSKEGVLVAETHRYPLQRSDAGQHNNTAPIESVFLPAKKLLWVGSSNYHYFILLGDKIVGLQPFRGPQLWVSYSTTNLSSSADQAKATKEYISKRIKDFSADPIRSDYTLSFGNIFEEQNFRPDGPSWYNVPVPVLDKVTFEGHEAILHFVIRGGKFTVACDENLQLVGASQDGLPVPVHGKTLLERKLSTSSE